MKERIDWLHVAGEEALHFSLLSGHVAIGNHWYAWLCRRQGLDAESTYFELLKNYDAPAVRGPINLEARRIAGFGEAELNAMTSWTTGRQ